MHFFVYFLAQLLELESANFSRKLLDSNRNGLLAFIMHKTGMLKTLDILH